MIISEPLLPEKALKYTAMATERTINTIPPVISYFHAKINAAIRMKAGILCIRNPIIFFPGESPPVKASSENNMMNMMETIPNILGSQKRIFFNISIVVYIQSYETSGKQLILACVNINTYFALDDKFKNYENENISPK